MVGNVNEVYLRLEIVKQIRDQFLSNKTIPSVHLHEFLDKSFYILLRKEIFGLKLKNEIDRLSHKHQSGKITGEINNLLNDYNLLNFISLVIGKHVRKIDATCFSFGTGDYTVLNDLGKEKPGIDFVLDLTDDWNKDAGGQIVYTENKGDGLVVNPIGNSLLLVQRKNLHVRRFVKYVNHHAGKNKRVLVVGKIL